METPPRVGIIGAGAIGKALTGHFALAGIETLISSTRPPWALTQVLAGLGPLVLATNFEETVSQELVVLAVPWDRVEPVLAQVSDWEARVLIDATNAVRADGSDTIDLKGRSSSRLVADLAPGAYVVKAFNTLPAAILAQSPGIGAARRVIFYSGDHLRSRQQVGRLIAAIGFSGIDLGNLETGGLLQQPPSGALSRFNLLQLPG